MVERQPPGKSDVDLEWDDDSQTIVEPLKFALRPSSDPPPPSPAGAGQREARRTVLGLGAIVPAAEAPPAAVGEAVAPPAGGAGEPGAAAVIPTEEVALGAAREPMDTPVDVEPAGAAELPPARGAEDTPVDSDRELETPPRAPLPTPTDLLDAALGSAPSVVPGRSAGSVQPSRPRQEGAAVSRPLGPVVPSRPLGPVVSSGSASVAREPGLGGGVVPVTAQAGRRIAAPPAAPPPPASSAVPAVGSSAATPVPAAPKPVLTGPSASADSPQPGAAVGGEAAKSSGDSLVAEPEVGETAAGFSPEQWSGEETHPDARRRQRERRRSWLRWGGFLGTACVVGLVVGLILRGTPARGTGGPSAAAAVSESLPQRGMAAEVPPSSSPVAETSAAAAEEAPEAPEEGAAAEEPAASVEDAEAPPEVASPPAPRLAPVRQRPARSVPRAVTPKPRPAAPVAATATSSPKPKAPAQEGAGSAIIRDAPF